MAVGRISGPLLKHNLLRNGVDLAFETDLLYLDVTNQKVGIKTTNPQYDLDVLGTIRSDDLLVQSVATIGDLTLSSDTISSTGQFINLGTFDNVIYQNRLSIDSIDIENNQITTNVSNTNLELTANGTGIVQVIGDMNVTGNIHATGNITADGSITLGDADTDNVVFAAEVASNIVPDLNNTYSLGTNPNTGGKSWNDVWVNNLIANTVSSQSLVLDGVDFTNRPGNSYYVGVNGNDAQSGDHPQDPYLTLKHALSQATTGDVIHIYPGEYEEQFPLEIPAGVSVSGDSLRGVTIKPTSATRYKDAFLLNGETTVENITITDFYSGRNNYTVISGGGATGSLIVNVGASDFAHTYVSGGRITNDNKSIDIAITNASYDHITGQITLTYSGTAPIAGEEVYIQDLTFSCNGGTRVFPDNGYGFRFATDFEVTSRSPYIKNVTIITKGSSVDLGTNTIDDPRGFNDGDAGKGAYVDGAYATANSREAAMLFHAVTMITPGVDALSATNGARIEWLNSFTYFANRGLHAFDSNDGLKGDGKTRIALASVTGTFQAGDTVTFTSADASTVATVTVESVSGKTLTVDGKDTQLVGFDFTPQSITAAPSGASAQEIINLDLQDFGAEIRMIGSANVYGNYGLYGDGPGVIVYAIGQNLAYIGNGKEVTNDPGTVIQANEVVELNDAKIRFNSVDHKGDFRVGDLFFVDQDTGSASFNVDNFNISTTNGVTITTGSDTTFIDGTEITTGDLRISGNTISSTTDINFSAPGDINLQSNVDISGDLGVTGDVTIGGNLTIGDQTTDTVQIVAGIDSNLLPNITSTYNLGSPTKSWKNLYINEAYIDDIEIKTNYISTTTSNADLELRAAGTGDVVIPNNDLVVTQDINVTGNGTLQDINADNVSVSNLTTTENLTVTGQTNLNSLTVSGDVQFEEILINDNFITTTTSNTDLELRAAGTGRVTTGEVVEVDADLTVTQNLDAGTIVSTGTTTTNSLVAGTISIYQGIVQQTSGGSNLVLRSNGLGQVLIDSNDATITGNVLVQGQTNLNGLVVNDSVTHTGDLDVSGNMDIGYNMNVLGTVNFNRAIFDLLTISGSTINATDAVLNPDLILSADASVIIEDDTIFEKDLTVAGTANIDSLVSTGTITANSFSNNVILVSGNRISTTESNADLELVAAGTGKITVPFNNVEITQDLNVIGTTDLDTVTVEQLTVNSDTSITGNLAVTGTITTTGQVTVNSQAQLENILINDNFITTLDSNSDLELRAAGTGDVIIPNNNLIVQNDLQVDGTGSFAELTTTGQVTVGGTLSVDKDLTVNGQAQLENILINDNFITTTQSNSDLELRANGTGDVIIPTNDVVISQDLEILGTATFNTLSATGTVQADSFSTGDILIDDNVITTTQSNSDLELVAAGTGEILIPLNDVNITQNLTVGGSTTLANLIVNGDITHTGNTTQTGNVSVTGNISGTGTLDVGGTASFENIRIGGNLIETIQSNSDLELRAAGTGIVRIPNNDLEVTGDLTVGGSLSLNSLTVNNSISAPIIETEDIRIAGNVIQTTLSNSDLELRANGSGTVTTTSNVAFSQNLSVDGNTTLGVTNITSTLSHVGDVVQTGNTSVTGNVSVTGDLDISGQAQFEEILIDDNFITTTTSNADLELRANGTGVVRIPNNNVVITNDLTITGDLIASDLTNLGVVSANSYSTGDILIDDNFITTTLSNSNLELRANGTGSILLDDIEVNNTTISSATDLTLASTSGNIVISGNGALRIPVGTTAQQPAGVAGQIRYNSDLSRFEGYNGTTWISLSGLEDADGDTKITTELTPGADDDTIRFYAGGSVVADVNTDRFRVNDLDLPEITFTANTIETQATNADLTLTGNGTGNVQVENFSFNTGTITNTVTDSITEFVSSGNGYFKIPGTGGFVIPVGTNLQKPQGLNTEAGMIRYNSSDGRVEIYNGTTWTSIAGTAGGISTIDAENIAIEYVIVLG